MATLHSRDVAVIGATLSGLYAARLTASAVANYDDSYDANRHIQTGHPVKTGNPYAKLIAGLMERGVQIGLCGATAAANHWGNANLLPEVKVNTNAMVRVTELEQKGFTLIYE
jgi:hypothetical protein